MNKLFCSTGLRWLWVTLLVLVADLASKQWISANFSLYQSLPLLPGVNITYVHNPGAAFSFLANGSGWQRWFFAVVAVVISLIILRMMYRTSARQRLINCAYALIVGGALGNLYDRLAHGAVIDFIDLYVQNWHWPTFNIADSAICIGALLMLLESFSLAEPTVSKKTVIKKTVIKKNAAASTDQGAAADPSSANKGE